MERIKDDIYKFSYGNSNSYLIKNKILIDGVSELYADEYINELEKTTDLGKITHIIVNHTKRNGSLNKILKKLPDITVTASTAGLKFLNRIAEKPFNHTLAKDGMILDADGIKLKLILTPYINWPDSMVTLYDGNLFSCELFSSYGNDYEKYYKNNLFTRSEYVSYALKKLSNEAFDIILPAEGDIRSGGFIGEYEKIIHKDEDFFVIIYHSVYGNTKKMAEIIKQSLDEKVKVFDAAKDDSDEIADFVNKSAALIIGTDTINADAPQKIWEIIAKTDKIVNKRKPCMIFGSYGWGGEGLYFLEEHLKMLKYKMFKKPFALELVIKPEDCGELAAYSKEFEIFAKTQSPQI